jgi:phosphatidylglycerophosphate synthase
LKPVVLVAAVGSAGLLELKVAGLSLAQRLSYIVKRAGLGGPYFLIAPHEGLTDLPPWARVVRDPSELGGFISSIDKESMGLPVLILDAGTLPDIECLQGLSRLPAEDRRVLKLPGMLFLRVRDAGFDLKELFEPDGFAALKDRLSRLASLSGLEDPRCHPIFIRSAQDVPEAERMLFKRLIKEGEGFMSRYVERPISLAISRRLVNTSITPNQITIISLLIGLAGAGLMALSKGTAQFLGALLFLAHSIVDGCDGEIARVKFMESRLGGILDFWGDNVVHSAVFMAIGFEWWLRTGSPLPMFLATAAVAGTFVSAGMVFFSTMRKKDGQGPLYTSVVDEQRQEAMDQRRRRIAAIADYLSRRDFIYLVVILAWFEKLEWFLVASAIGTWCFAAALIYLKLRR